MKKGIKGKKRCKKKGLRDKKDKEREDEEIRR